ncbi:hypothetical protein K7396_33885 [Streptomyces angustmyceticus]|nr:hypothetical protein K7396_33885 [Streptomyces angustmyceticus]
MAVPPGVVTVTGPLPGACGAVMATMVVSLSTWKLAAGVPTKVTAVAPVKPVPVMVTWVPPVVLPEAGVNPLIVGAGVT